MGMEVETAVFRMLLVLEETPECPSNLITLFTIHDLVFYILDTCTSKNFNCMYIINRKLKINPQRPVPSPQNMLCFENLIKYTESM